MKGDNPIGTVFSAESTNHDIKDQPNLEMMSAHGKRLAAKTAPTSLSRDTSKILTSSVDRKMRGGK